MYNPWKTAVSTGIFTVVIIIKHDLFLKNKHLGFMLRVKVVQIDNS